MSTRPSLLTGRALLSARFPKQPCRYSKRQSPGPRKVDGSAEAVLVIPFLRRAGFRSILHRPDSKAIGQRDGFVKRGPATGIIGGAALCKEPVEMVSVNLVSPSAERVPEIQNLVELIPRQILLNAIRMILRGHACRKSQGFRRFSWRLVRAACEYRRDAELRRRHRFLSVNRFPDSRRTPRWCRNSDSRRAAIDRSVQ